MGPGSDDLLRAHLRAWLGAWPPDGPVDVVSAGERTRPGWDGRVRPLLGVAAPGRTLLSVAPEHADAVARVAGPLSSDGVRRAIVDAVGLSGTILGRGVFRWPGRVPDTRQLPDAGEWIDVDDPRVPAWLRPFNYGQVLIAWDDTGGYGAGVGIKRHDGVGHELAVVTTPRLRGRGLAQRLIAQAARRILDEGGLPTYHHATDNAASARVADAAGFPDRGWSVYGLFDASAEG